jgi:hypothetical protein
MRWTSKHRAVGTLRRLCALLCSLGAWLPGVSWAQSDPIAAVSSNRFLCVFDSSAAMHQQAEETHKALRSILESRASGQLHYGDTIGVWTFDSELHTGYFPLQVWLPGQEDEVTLRLLEFQKQQPLGRTSRLGAAMAGLNEVVADSDIIAIFIFSTGQSPMQGTPFDDAINGEYQRALADMGAKRMPIVTVLEARGGRYVKYSVNALPWPVVIPELPIHIAGENNQVAAKRPPAAPVAPKPVAVAAPVAVAQTKPVAPQPTAVVAAAPPAAVVPPATVIQASTPAAQPRPVVQPPPPPVVAAPTPVVPPPSPLAAVQPVAAKPVPPALAAPKLIVPTPAPVPAAPMLVAAAKPAVAASATNAAAPVAAPKPAEPVKAGQAANAPQPEAPAAVATSGMMGPNTLLVAGCALLVMAGVLVVMITRRSRAAQGPSLITRSMDSRRK